MTPLLSQLTQQLHHVLKSWLLHSWFCLWICCPESDLSQCHKRSYNGSFMHKTFLYISLIMCWVSQSKEVPWYLDSFDTNYIIFNMLIFLNNNRNSKNNLFFCELKALNLQRVFHSSKWKFQNWLNYSTDMCWSVTNILHYSSSTNGWFIAVALMSLAMVFSSISSTRQMVGL
jgi:hypothetical protein